MRASRSPKMTYGTREDMLASLADVASCDSRPLLVGHAKDERRRQALEKSLATLAWSEPFIGRYHYVS